jgi:ribosome maturation factor RimP
MGQNDKEQLAKVLEPHLAGLGYELVEVIVSRYRANVTVRVFVYGEQGVTVGDCARLARVIGDLIEGTGMFPGGYALEVSSPGLDRPLTTAGDFRRRVGETVRVSFVDSGRKQFTAEIIGVSDEVVEFSGDTGEVRVPVAEIAQAKIVF